MKLIGMLDSPYVRRVAIAFEYLGLAFEHQALSVFSTFEEFRQINPVVKAPTLVCDNGDVLMDSTLILQYAEAVLGGEKSLWPADTQALQAEIRALGLALAACDKCVQIVYERNLRPATAQYGPWLERVVGQTLAAYNGLEQTIEQQPAIFARPSHPCIMAAVAWQFTQSALADLVPAAQFPQLIQLSARMEKYAEFLKYPAEGPGVPAN